MFMKKVFSTLLAFVIIFEMSVVPAFAHDNEERITYGTKAGIMLW